MCVRKIIFFNKNACDLLDTFGIGYLIDKHINKKRAKKADMHV